MSSDALQVEAIQNNFLALYNTLQTKVTAVSAAQTQAEAQPLFEEAESALRVAENQLRDIESERRHFDLNGKKILDRKIKEFQGLLQQQKQALGEHRERLTLMNMSAAKQAEWREQRMRLLENRHIQDSTTNSLTRTEQMIGDAIVISNDTSVTLESQTEQMGRMLDTLHETDSVLDRSKALLRRMRTRLVTNKLLTFLIILIELGILALIIYVKYYS